MQNYYPPSHVEKKFPTIDLGDFILREKQESDLENFYRYYSDPEVNKFIMSDIPQNLQQAKQELLYWRGTFHRNDGIYFAIASKADDKLIGAIGLTSHNTFNSRIELSYDLAKEYWRQGIMTTAIAAVIKHAFETIRINRIEASVAITNIPSHNLLIKCGFKLEGILRQHRFHQGRYVDVAFFSMLRNDYLQ
jgi:ribosomal-protein-alanine N-acetyltransferase